MKKTIILLTILIIIFQISAEKVTAQSDLQKGEENSASIPLISRYLEEGMSGNDVMTLQAILAADPEIYPEGIVSGYYGSFTAKAVKNFQKKNGLETVGRVGPKTLKVIKEMMAQPEENIFGLEQWQSYDSLAAKGEIEKVGYIFETSISYDADSIPVLKINEVVKKRGGVPKNIFRNREYTLKILDSKGETIFSIPFDVPNKIIPEPPLDNAKGFAPIVLKKTDFILNVPSLQEGAQLKIYDLAGKEITSKSLLDVKEVKNKINFRTTKAKRTRLVGGQRLSFKEGNNLLTGNTIGNSTLFSQSFAAGKISLEESGNQGANPSPDNPEGDRYLDITFLSSGYSQENLDAFHLDVDLAIKRLLSVEPFKSRASQLRFHYIDSPSEWGCDKLTNECDWKKISKIANNSGVIYDVLAVFHRIQIGSKFTDPLGYASPSYAISLRTGSRGADTMIHELGHAIGLLDDEYVYARFYAGYSEKGGYNPNLLESNCYVDTRVPPPSPYWKDLVAPYDYKAGCSYTDWYRPSDDSIMMVTADDSFNAVSQYLINKVLDAYSGPFIDNVAPAVNISSPKNGAVVAGQEVKISISPSDNNGVAWSQLWIDGELYQVSAHSPSRAFAWNTFHHSNGQHTLQVKSYDVAGNVGVSPSINVIVNNATDNTKPSVSIVSPSKNQNVSGIVNVQVSASDNFFVKKVELYKNGTLLDADTLSPFVFFWDTTQEENGVYSLQAKAYDPSGNVGTSSLVQVNLQKPVDTEPPTIYSIQLERGAFWVPVIYLYVEATDNVGIAKVEFYRDNEEKPFYVSSKAVFRDWQYIVGTDPAFNLPAGLHYFKAKVVDYSGNTAVSETVSGEYYDWYNVYPIAKAGPSHNLTVGVSHTHTGASATDPNGDLDYYRWNWSSCPSACPSLENRSGKISGYSASIPGPTFTPNATGTYYLYLFVDDSFGDSYTYLVEEAGSAPPTNHPPIANAGPDQTGTVGASLTFDASNSSDPDGDTLAYTWNFGDNSPLAAGKIVSHAYAAAGTYTVLLTVSDGKATSTDSAIVTIIGTGENAFFDNFDRPDSNVIGNGWVVAKGGFNIKSNTLQTAPGMTGPAIAVVPSLYGSSQSVSADFISTNNYISPQFGFILRYQNASNYYKAYCQMTGQNSGNLKISKVVNGKESVLKQLSFLPGIKENTLFHLTATVSGNNFTLSIKDRASLTAVDSANTYSNGSLGILMNSSDNQYSQIANNFYGKISESLLSSGQFLEKNMASIISAIRDQLEIILEIISKKIQELKK